MPTVSPMISPGHRKSLTACHPTWPRPIRDDNLIRKINRRVLVPLAVTLVLIIAADFVYSNFVPNTGYGITGNFDNEDDVAIESVLEEG